PRSMRPDARLRAYAALVGGEELQLAQADVLVDLQSQLARVPPDHLVSAQLRAMEARTRRAGSAARARGHPGDTFPSQVGTAPRPDRHGRSRPFGWRGDSA